MTEWRSQLLASEHDLSSFGCGVPALEAWLTSQALRAQGSDTARTWVWTRPDSDRVQAYFSIAPTQVRREEVGRAMSGGVTTVPAYLLARLALDTSLHGQGLGSELLVDALGRIVHAAASAAGRLIVVDAIDDGAAHFYEHHDFRRIGDTHRLVLKVATAQAALAAEQRSPD